MSNFEKMSVQAPGVVKERFFALPHGQKQLVSTSGLIWYFNADKETQQLYRAWAQAIAEGNATMEEPPEILKPAFAKMAAPSGRPARRARN